ncbi:hypothetical protein GOC91_03345 [Sinorhizobium medicae]|nr:hypothetical protein [Sinorhizobium medicae]MDX0877936.1 hypothetical protein [Sinorhizobium medicae]
MINWRQGGWTGSLRKWVRSEIRKQARDNLVRRRCRYPWFLRTLRAFFAERTFGRFVCYYAALALLITLLDLVVSRRWPEILPEWTRDDDLGHIEGLLTTLAGYLITAQVGVLGVIAVAIGLVTLIVQSEDSRSDVQVYYHEALAMEVVASSFALLAALVAQILWPLQFLLHYFGEGADLQISKLFLAVVHIFWLLVNLAGLAHFIETTFRFVQKSSREKLRERYTANVLHPVHTTTRVAEWLYENAGANLIEHASDPHTTVTFGFDWGEPVSIELERVFDPPLVVYDVKFLWIRWAVRRWWARCQKETRIGRTSGVSGLMQDEPRLVFTPVLGTPLRGKVAWCWTRGGVPLTPLERWVIEHSFRFARATHDT